MSIDCIIGTEQFLQVNWNQFLKVPSNGVLTFSIAVPWMISPYMLVSVSQLSWRCGVSCKACWHWHVYLWAQAQHRAFVPQLYGRCGVKRPCDWPDESPQAHAPMNLIRWQHLRTYYDISFCLYMYAIMIFIGSMIFISLVFSSSIIIGILSLFSLLNSPSQPNGQTTLSPLPTVDAFTQGIGNRSCWDPPPWHDKNYGS